MVELVGQKIGMTRFLAESGAAIPVTVIKIEPNRVVQIKNVDNDGYSAVQVAIGVKPLSKVSKSLAGHFAKAKVEPGLCLREFRIADDDVSYKVGMAIGIDVFKPGDEVDVQSVSKGKGFAGVIKRYNFRTQDATHGNSLSHRAPGSIGQRQTPGRVFKGKKMAGHMGDVTCTMQSQKVVHIDLNRNLLLVKGGVPGAPNARVVVKHAAKGGAQ